LTNKFQNKYRIPSARLQNWDYGWNAFYFVTICTQNREHYFGEIENDEMIFSDIGKIVRQEWIKTFEMRPDMNLTMDEYVIMPNHFHAIIIIGKNKYNSECRDAMHCVSNNTDTHNQKIWHPLFVVLK
jgi:REP element-mobilizing transposase RayT